MYSIVKLYTKELIILTILLFTCLFNYFIQQVFVPFLLPINSIILVYLVSNKFNVQVFCVILCALLDEQLLGYSFGSLVTIYSFICFIILNFNKYTRLTLILSILIWFCINYHTNNIIQILGH